MVGKRDIYRLLEELKISRNATVTVHISLRSVGRAENGADGIIDAFCDYLNDGLFIVPTHTWDNVTAQSPFYDAAKTPPCIGTLPQVAAFRSDGFRSLHPTHSVAVFGKRAEEYIIGEELSASPAPVGGCLSRLYEEKGKILLIGVGQNRNTYLHAVDERLSVPNRLNPDGFVIEIVDKHGRKMLSPPFHTHFSKGIDCCCSEFYPNYNTVFDACGVNSYSTLGNAAVCCCDAKKATDTAAVLWQNADYDLCAVSRQIAEKYLKK